MKATITIEIENIEQDGFLENFENMTIPNMKEEIEEVITDSLSNHIGFDKLSINIDEKTEKKELLDCIHNLMGFFDTPVAKMQMRSDDCEEVRQIGRDVMKKYGRNPRGI